MSCRYDSIRGHYPFSSPFVVYTWVGGEGGTFVPLRNKYVKNGYPGFAWRNRKWVDSGIRSQRSKLKPCETSGWKIVNFINPRTAFLRAISRWKRWKRQELFDDWRLRFLNWAKNDPGGKRIRRYFMQYLRLGANYRSTAARTAARQGFISIRGVYVKSNIC